MKIIKKEVERMTIEEFADRHELEMEVIERSPKNVKEMGIERYCAHFNGFPDINKGNFLYSEFGNGNTEKEAIKDYAKKISEQTLVFTVIGTSRKEIEVPVLVEK